MLSRIAAVDNPLPRDEQRVLVVSGGNALERPSERGMLQSSADAENLALSRHTSGARTT